jgi:hypothetical protein
MKTKYLFIAITIFIISSSFKITRDWAQAWVDDKVSHKTELSWAVRKHTKPKTLALILLPKEDLAIKKNGNKYLKCYLINNTDSISLIKRSGNTIDFTSEIYKDKTWQHYQKGLPAWCGNSFWTQKLDSQKMLSIRYDHPDSGSVNVSFRLKFLHDKKPIYSNEIIVNINQKSFDRIGIKKSEKY